MKGNLQKAVIHIVIGGIIMIGGAMYHDSFRWDDPSGRMPGIIITILGGIYLLLTSKSAFLVIMSVLRPLFGLAVAGAIKAKGIADNVKMEAENKKKSKARKALLEYKTLLDGGVISQEDYDLKTAGFKDKI